MDSRYRGYHTVSKETPPLIKTLCNAFVTVTGLFVHRGAPFLALDKNSPSMLHGKEK
jgi:hypothetical protein